MQIESYYSDIKRRCILNFDKKWQSENGLFRLKCEYILYDEKFCLLFHVYAIF